MHRRPSVRRDLDHTRNAGRPRRAFTSPVSLLRFQRIQPVRHPGERRLDLAELAIGFHVDFVIELGALVLVGVLAVLADEDEARDQDRLDGEDDPEEAVGIASKTTPATIAPEFRITQARNQRTCIVTKCGRPVKAVTLSARRSREVLCAASSSIT